MTQQQIHSLSVDFLLKNSKMMQPPILTRQEATLWLKVSAHSTLNVFEFQFPNTFRFADFQTASRAAIIKLKKQHAHLQTTLTAHRNKMFDIAYQHNTM